MYQVGDFVKLSRQAPHYMLRYAGLRGEVVQVPGAGLRQHAVVVRFFVANRQRSVDKSMFTRWLTKA